MKKISRKTKRLCLFLIVVSLSVKAYSQKVFVYKNEEYNIEVAFPDAPGIIDYKQMPENKQTEISNEKLRKYSEKISKKIDTKLLGVTSIAGGFWYSVEISEEPKSYLRFDELMKSISEKFTVKGKYSSGKIEATEYEIVLVGGSSCTKYKVINYNKMQYKLSVNNMLNVKLCVEDKDAYPFFNSLKIGGVPILNPLAETSRFKVYNIDYNANMAAAPQLETVNINSGTDTVKQIVYVKSGKKSGYQYEKLSDVDKNIPLNTLSNPYRFALIIGNEDYTSRQVDLKTESNVEFARNDASAFKEYCMNTMGIPEKNITFLLDATSGQISQGISKLKLLSKASGGKSQLIVFYAGHGLPDEKTKEPYLIPVDVNGSNVTAGIKLQDLYNSLTEFPSERIMVFLDACFTGGGRNAGLVASRGVKIMPKEDVLKGNLVVFSSSSGEQSSLPYADQKHGMFTYYLLKKLQETKGDVTYSDLSKFLDEKVSIESLLVNSKEQNPVVNTSQAVSATWKMWKAK
jgi:hypothetical protein